MYVLNGILIYPNSKGKGTFEKLSTNILRVISEVCKYVVILLEMYLRCSLLTMPLYLPCGQNLNPAA